MARKLISLEGATVIWNDELNQSPFNENESFNINFSCNSNSYSRIIPYFGDGSYSSTTLAYGYSDVYSYTTSNHGWYNASYKTIIISGGTDATNHDLIQWIQANATIEGGVWEEEKSSLIIKNPVCLIGSKAKKVIVDNVNLTIDVWTKEVPSGLTIPTDLTEYQIDVPAGWSATSGHGSFDLVNAVSLNDYYSNFVQLYFGIGYSTYFDGEIGGSSPTSNSCSSFNSYGFPPFTNFVSSQSFSLFIKSGSDVTNQALIQWFVDNNATFTKIPHSGGA